MTAGELFNNLLNRQAVLSVPSRAGTLEVRVRILDARETFGRIDLLVSPVEGSGQAWVSADRVKVEG